MTDKNNTALMPKELTAENRSKYLFIGEFYEEVEFTCPDCDGVSDSGFTTDYCGTCKGEGIVTNRVYVSWSNIKAIYKKAVKHLEIKE